MYVNESRPMSFTHKPSTCMIAVLIQQLLELLLVTGALVMTSTV